VTRNFEKIDFRYSTIQVQNTRKKKVRRPIENDHARLYSKKNITRTTRTKKTDAEKKSNAPRSKGATKKTSNFFKPKGKSRN